MTTIDATELGALRARDYGIELEGTPGPWNAITDVAGVEVGYETLIQGNGSLEPGGGPVRSGVTAVLQGRPASWRYAADLDHGWPEPSSLHCGREDGVCCTNR